MTTRRVLRGWSSLRALSVFMLAGLVALGAGFVWFVIVAEQPARPPPHADGIVALTGGADRIETAFRLLAAGDANLLLISGVAHGAALPALERRVDIDPAVLEQRVTLGRTATSTFGNAGETAAWVEQHGIHSLIVVTAGYHMPRALLELGRALPGVVLYAVPVQPPGMREPGWLRLLVVEYLRLIAAACGLSHRLHGHPLS
jgi:uncharacterized SAM-binding protein YcdF (DUF218 family)